MFSLFFDRYSSWLWMKWPTEIIRREKPAIRICKTRRKTERLQPNEQRIQKFSPEPYSLSREIRLNIRKLYTGLSRRHDGSNPRKQKRTWKNKPGTAQVGAMSKAQNSKRTSKCQVFYSTVPAWGKKSKKNSRNFFEDSGKSHSAENVKGGRNLGSFWTSILLQNRKKWRGSLWRHLKKMRKKVSQSRNSMYKNFLDKGETRTHVLLPGRPQKIVKKSEAENVTLMWQLVEASL